MSPVPFDPNASWTAEIGKQSQSPVYFLRIAGLTTKDYSTHPVDTPAVSKVVLMETPRGGAQAVDILGGGETIASVQVDLLDVGGEITDLISTLAPGAPLSSLINRKCTIYGGYQYLLESAYPPIFVGTIRSVEMIGLTAFRFELRSIQSRLDAEIMTSAGTGANRVVLRGNPVNLYASLLRGVFSVSDPDFPLDFIQGIAGGLGIADAEIDIAQIKTERDRWFQDDVVERTWTEPVNAAEELRDEFFRTFQGYPLVGGDGKFGLGFHVPPVPASSAATLDKDHIVNVRGWRVAYEDHLNKFRVEGDWNYQSQAFDANLEAANALYQTDTAEDTADRTATGETITYLLQSKWIRSSLDGAQIAAELMNRLRSRYIHTPAVLECDVTFRRRNVVQGLPVRVTHPDVPDLFTGARGITDRLMTVVGITPDYPNGLLRLRLLDAGYKKYGCWAPAGTANYAAATSEQRETFAYVGNSTNQMSTGAYGNRLA